MLDEDQKSLFMNWLGEHGSSVMKVARAYTLTSEECQDLAQEILLQAWRSLPKFEGKASAATWFYRVALHTAMNWHRKDKPRRSRQQPLLEVQALATEGVDSAEQAQHRDTVEQLYKAIHQLPKTDAALVLLYLDELSYREMAEVLGISESNVGVKLNRAKKALSELMKDNRMNPDSHMDPDSTVPEATCPEVSAGMAAQSSQTRVTIDADLLLKEVQRYQRDFRATIFCRDFREVVVALLMLPVWFYMGITMSLPWTWYLTVPVLVWMAGFMLVYRMRHKQEPSEPDESLLQCVKRSLTEVGGSNLVAAQCLLVVSTAVCYFNPGILCPCCLVVTVWRLVACSHLLRGTCRLFVRVIFISFIG